MFFFPVRSKPQGIFLNALIFLSKSKAKQKTHQQTFAERCTMRSQQLIVHIKLEKTTSCLLSICGIEFKKITMITNYTFNSPVFTQETQFLLYLEKVRFSPDKFKVTLFLFFRF